LATAVGVSRTNNPEIDGLLAGTKWSGTISYSFPDSPSDYAANYYGDGEPTTSGFSSAPAAMQQAINYAISLIAGYTNASFQYAGTNGSDIAIAQSPAANPTSYAYYPASVPAGGDIWFGTAYNYSLAALGNYYFVTALHELGHSLGLKHSQETGGVANVAVPSAHDDSEYTVMSYRSYVGAPLTGYTSESYGYAQTYMANDILALQTLYGANYSTHGENTVYSWSPTTGQEFINGVAQLAPGNGAGGSANRVFETIWDGNGVDTYDLSNYSTGVTINLNPGASSITSAVQLAYLGNGHYASGNIYNAYLYNGDARSYIDNAIGGSGNDTITGNAIANILTGGAGNDTLDGGGGNDTIIGGAGTDIMTGGSGADNFVFGPGDSPAANGQHDRIVDFTSGVDHIDLSGIDAIAGTASRDLFRFIGAGGFTGSAGELNDYYDSARGVTVLQGDTNGDRVADFAIDLSGSLNINFLDLIGVAVVPVVIESFGATSLTQVGGSFYLYQNGTSSGPLLKYGGTPFVVNQFGWAAIGGEQTAGGYEVAWNVLGTDQYTVWNVDSSGNFVSNTMGVVSGTSRGFESIETSFHQDLNGDGVIGVASTMIEAAGVTGLVEIGSNFYLDGSSSGPMLKYGGAAFVVNQFGWAAIGAEQTAGGYEVAWRVLGADQFTVWNVDSNGNFVSNTMGVVSGTSRAFESVETSFHQDLNGDGAIGVVPTVIEASGVTSLVQVGSNFYLGSGSSDPMLKFGGTAFVANQFGWAAIGAEQTADGYEVAWRVPGADQFTVWNVDSSGNFVSNTMGVVSGTSRALESVETSFNQDLNGDGAIGVVPTVIEASGVTSLVQVGSNFYLGSGSSDPMLKFGGTAFVANQFGWAAIGAEQTPGGYEVAWRVPGADQFTVWNVDSSGSFVSNTMGVVSGSSSALESIETSFHQDLNGDGTIGVVVAHQNDFHLI